MKRYWEWEPVFEWTPAQTALLVIDMQKGFVNETSPLYVPMAREQVPVTQRVVSEFENRSLHVFYTRFVVSQSDYFPFYRRIASQRGIDALSADAPFSSHGVDAQIVDELRPETSENVIDKVGYDGFAGTDLETRLRERGIETIVFTGTVVNWCVDSTLRSAFHKRFNSIVLSDCVSGYDHAGVSAAGWVSCELDMFAEAFAQVMPAKTLIGQLDAGAGGDRPQNIASIDDDFADSVRRGDC